MYISKNWKVYYKIDPSYVLIDCTNQPLLSDADYERLGLRQNIKIQEMFSLFKSSKIFILVDDFFVYFCIQMWTLFHKAMREKIFKFLCFFGKYLHHFSTRFVITWPEIETGLGHTKILL